MRQVAVSGGTRPASRGQARSPAGPATRQSQAAAYGFQGLIPRGSTGTTIPNGDGYPSLTGNAAANARAAGGSFRNAPCAAPGTVAAPEPRGPRSSRLAVVVRKRPMNRRELQAQQQDVVTCKNNAVIVREPKLKVDLTRYVEEHNFLFDHSFDDSVTNEQLYCTAVRPVIDAVFHKAKCTCFAYGQTGSGKTFTMMGPPRRLCEGIPEKDRTPGIFLLAAQDIFRCLASKEHEHLEIHIAFYEIYCGKLFDLLNHRQMLHARENAKSNVVIVGLHEHPVDNVQDLMEVIEFGLTSRTTGVTGANVDSSRSHAILQISLKDARFKEDGKLKEHGKISFIDLAGSERGADTHDTDRQTRIDGAEINKSLLALKECIRALDQQQDHTPFRGSKLTQVLKDSFVGANCRTVMIANVSPSGCAVEHSLNTLRYAYRVKELRRAAGGGSVGSMDLGSFNDYVPPMTAQGELPIEEEPSDDDSEVEVSRRVKQQLHVASMSTAAQPLDGHLFELHQNSVQQQPEEVPVAQEYIGINVPRSSSISDNFMTSNPESVHYSGERVDANALNSATTTSHRGSDSAGTLAVQSQDQDLAPEVALEPVGCSQAALDELARQHDRLIGTILAEEEELITSHRTHIDLMVELIKEEMVHLNSVDRPGSDVDAYVAGLDRILRMKAEYINDIRGRVDVFKEHLKQEDTLSRKFQTLTSSS